MAQDGQSWKESQKMSSLQWKICHILGLTKLEVFLFEKSKNTLFFSVVIMHVTSATLDILHIYYPRRHNCS